MYHEAGCEVEGVALVQKKMFTVAGETAKGMERAIVVNAIRLQRWSQEVVPVDTGRLHDSAFTSKEGSGFQTVASVGYSTEYAIYVHEDTLAKHEPGKVHHYLTAVAQEKQSELFQHMREEAAFGNYGSIPQLAPPPLAQHAVLPIQSRPAGVKLLGGKVVTYVRKANSKNGHGGWRRKR